MKTIELPAHFVPCRTCKAAPGESCFRRTLTDHGLAGRDYHKTRERDAAKVSELIEW